MADFPSYVTLPETGAGQITMDSVDVTAINRKRFYLQLDGYNTELREFYQVLQNVFALPEIMVGTWTLTGVGASGSSAYESASASITISAGITTEVTLSPATAGGPSAPSVSTRLNRGNAYGWLEDFNTYFSTLYGASAWEAATDADKEKLILIATSQIDNATPYIGSKLDAGQQLEFPRFYRRGSLNTADEQRFIPREVFEATAEQAFSILNTGSVTNKRKELQAQGVKSISIGRVSESYVDGAGSSLSSLCAPARALLDSWINRFSEFGSYSPYERF